MKLTDEQLLDDYRKWGRRELLDELLGRHLALVRNLAFRMTLDEEGADDIAQQALLHAVQGINSFNGQCNFRTWLYRVTLNAAYDFLDRKKRSPIQYTSEWSETDEGTVPPPQQSALMDELFEQLTAAIAELSPKMRAAIVLTVIEQLDVAQAAKIEGCSTATMYWRIHEARKQLKVRLGDYLSL